MSYNIELEIRSAFKKADLMLNKKTDESIILRILSSRSIFNWITIDIIENISTFISPYDILSLILSSKTTIKFLPEVWIIIHNRQYNKSILPKNHLLIKNQMMLRAWYYDMYLNTKPESFKNFIKIEINESYIYKRKLENKNSKNKIRKYFNKREIKSYEKENERLIEDSYFDDEILEKFKNNNLYGMFYKGDIDMRIYGLDPIKDHNLWYNSGIKWGKYIYNDIDIEYELYYNHFINHEDEWNYDYKYIKATCTELNDGATLLYYDLSEYKVKYRSRKLPEWF